MDVAQGKFDAIQEDRAFGREGQLLLAAVEELDAEFSLQFLDGHRDVWLRDTEPFGSPGDISQTAGHLEIFKLS